MLVKCLTLGLSWVEKVLWFCDCSPGYCQEVSGGEYSKLIYAGNLESLSAANGSLCHNLASTTFWLVSARACLSPLANEVTYSMLFRAQRAHYVQLMYM